LDAIAKVVLLTKKNTLC